MNCLHRIPRQLLMVTICVVLASCASQVRLVTDPTERFTGKGFSALPPQGAEWYILGHNEYAVYFGRQPNERNHTFIAMVQVMPPETKNVESAEDFTIAIERVLRQSLGNGERFNLLSVRVSQFGSPHSYCAQYDLVQEDRSKYPASGIILETEAHGFVCLDVSSEFMIRADYSERKTPEMVSVFELDETLKRDVEEFLENVKVTPLRDN